MRGLFDTVNILPSKGAGKRKQFLSDNTGYKWLQFAEEFVALESPSAWHSKEVELEPDPADEKVDHNSGHGKCHPADEKAKNTTKITLQS